MSKFENDTDIISQFVCLRTAGFDLVFARYTLLSDAGGV